MKTSEWMPRKELFRDRYSGICDCLSSIFANPTFQTIKIKNLPGTSWFVVNSENGVSSVDNMREPEFASITVATEPAYPALSRRWKNSLQLSAVERVKKDISE